MNKCTMTVDQLAETLGISRPIAYTLVNRADFPAIRIGKRIVIPISAFEEWMANEANRTEGGA